jgi:uncharacterized protein (DUF427 family)
MALTFGTGPFGDRAAGRFNTDPALPDPLLYFERYPLRVRAVLAGEVVADSRETKLLHSSGALPVFWFPVGDISHDCLTRGERTEVRPGIGEIVFHDLSAGGRTAHECVRESLVPADGAEFLHGHAFLDWDAIDEWFTEDLQIHGHPKDPYTRIDIVPTTRHVKVSLDGVTLAESRRTKLLQETSLPARFYFPPEDVRTELLVPSSQRSRCAYKGSAAYWSVRVGDHVVEDLVWTYADPEPEAAPVRDLLCFFSERVDVELDGEPQERPRTQWARKREDVVGGGQALRGLMGRRV